VELAVARVAVEQRRIEVESAGAGHLRVLLEEAARDLDALRRVLLELATDQSPGCVAGLGGREATAHAREQRPADVAPLFALRHAQGLARGQLAQPVVVAFGLPLLGDAQRADVVVAPALVAGEPPEHLVAMHALWMPNEVASRLQRRDLCGPRRRHPGPLDHPQRQRQQGLDHAGEVDQRLHGALERRLRRTFGERTEQDPGRALASVARARRAEQIVRIAARVGEGRPRVARHRVGVGIEGCQRREACVGAALLFQRCAQGRQGEGRRLGVRARCRGVSEHEPRGVRGQQHGACELPCFGPEVRRGAREVFAAPKAAPLPLDGFGRRRTHPLGARVLGRMSQRPVRQHQRLALASGVEGRFGCVQCLLTPGLPPTHLGFAHPRLDPLPLGRVRVAREELLPVRERLTTLERQWIALVEIERIAQDGTADADRREGGGEQRASDGLGHRIEGPGERDLLRVAHAGRGAHQRVVGLLPFEAPA
jgi:hypothetical protein